MTDDFQLDARRWRFLDRPSEYIRHPSSNLQREPLDRQFKTAKEILARFKAGRGVLLADDVGLGKTTVAALVAWVVACQDKRVRVYAPNKVLQRRWAEELERHALMLGEMGASHDRIKQGEVGRLHAGYIQVTTHYALTKSHRNGEDRTACDLMVIDEVHRAKGVGSAFNEALRNLGARAKRKLILTATPFSIRPQELQQLLAFVGAPQELKSVSDYSKELDRLYALGSGHSEIVESKRLVSAAEKAIEELRPYLIRHGVEDLSETEQKFFGLVGQDAWEIPTPQASKSDLELLLRMDRLLQFESERQGKRRNDPRFHTGWQHVGDELERVSKCACDSIARRHIDAASKSLRAKRNRPHPKIAAISDSIKPLIDKGEKVLIFCHHHATAGELLDALERSLKKTNNLSDMAAESVWREAWEYLLADGDPLVQPIIDWFCTPGLRTQIGGWLGRRARTAKELRELLEASRPRWATGRDVPTIRDSAVAFKKALLDPQSTSTRKVLERIADNVSVFGGEASHFPGHLDEGLRVMGAWKEHDEHNNLTKTLYRNNPDILLALFNSPFGPDVLITTDWLSEGVDLHRCCRHLIHYELDPSPVRTVQRNGRIRRVGSWAALTGKPIQYAYPSFAGTRDEQAVKVMRQRIGAFGLLLGGVPSLDDRSDEEKFQSFAEKVLRRARNDLQSLNQRLTLPA